MHIKWVKDIFPFIISTNAIINVLVEKKSPLHEQLA